MVTELKIWLVKQGMTQKDLAKRLGYNREYVSRIVNGSLVAPDSFRWRFGKEFGFDLARMLFEGHESDN